MKRYTLLKDLPTFKAGEKFFISDSGNLIAGTPSNPKKITVETRYGLTMKIDLMAYAQETLEEFPNILKDWFEEIKEPELPKEFFCIDIDKVICYNFSYFSSNKNTRQEYIRFMEKYKSVGNYFETKEEAEKYLKYLKAKAIIKEDTKGAHFYWKDVSRVKYYGVWNCQLDILNKHLGLEYREIITDRASTIYFNSEKDIEESFKKHPEEWKTYLTYEQ